MIPLRDVIPSRTTPYITVTIIILNALAWFYELALPRDVLPLFLQFYGVVPADFTATTLVSSMFLHGSWSHIIGNMVFFWAFGPEIEDAMNPLRFSAFYLSGGLVAMLAQVVASPSSTVPNLGASGAIAAVMGAFLVTYPRDRMRSLLVIFIFVRVTFIPAALLIVVWFLTQLLNAGAVAKVQTGGVAYLAHIGGCIFGAVTARWFEDPQRIAEQRWSE